MAPLTCDTYTGLCNLRLHLIACYEQGESKEVKCKAAVAIQEVEKQIREVGILRDSFFDTVPQAKECLCPR